MDKFFRKRSLNRKDKNKKQQQQQQQQLKYGLPRLPPTLDVDIRNSLMLPQLTDRFSVLLPSFSNATETSVRNLFQLQRQRQDGPSLTVEEEELLLAELRLQNQERSGGPDASTSSSAAAAAAQTRASRGRTELSSVVSAGSLGSWDGNPPPFDVDWGSASGRSTSRLAKSPSSSSQLAVSEGGTHTPAMTPSNSSRSLTSPGPGGHSNFQSFGPTTDRNRPVPRSYGFSGGVGQRDKDYLRSVEKATDKTASPASTSANVTPSPKRLIKSPSQRRKPLPDMNSSPAPGAAAQSPDPSAVSTSATTTPIAGASSTSVNKVAAAAAAAFGMPGQKSDSGSSALKRNGSVNGLGSIKPGPRPQNAMRSSTIRQSLLVGFTPAQHQRISRALVEIEQQLHRQTATIDLTEDIVDERDEDADESNNNSPHGKGDQQHKPSFGESDREEVLDNGVGDETVTMERQYSNTSASVASSVFPFSASPASSARGLDGGARSVSEQTPPPRIPSLPSSPLASSQTLSTVTEPTESEEHEHQSQPQSHSHSQSPSQSLPQGHPQGTSPAQARPQWQGHQSTESTTSSTVSSHTDSSIPQPALKPYRPQPVRASPSPALGSPSNAARYIPGQPRPVRQTGSISSMGSAIIGSPQSPLSPPSSNASSFPARVLYPGTAAAGGPGTTQNGGMSMSASNLLQSTSSLNTTQSRPGTQQGHRMDHVPPPGVLSSRHNPSISISESLASWRGGSFHTTHSSLSHSVNSPSSNPVSELEDGSRSVPNGISARHLQSSSGSSNDHFHRRNLSTTSERSAPPAQSHHTRGESISTVGSSFEGPTTAEDPLSWEAILGERKEEPEAENWDSDLQFFKDSTHMDKEDLLAMQDRLVAKAKAERDRLRAAQGGADEELSPVKTYIASAVQSPEAAPRSQTARSASPVKANAEPEPQQSLVDGVTAGLAFLGVDDVPSHFPKDRVPSAELPKGPPPRRPDPPSATNGNIRPQPATADNSPVAPGRQPVSTAPSSPVKTTEPGHSSHPSQNWLQDDPDARRDIEQRIADATSSLFRVPSRSAHKRQISKGARKQISAPTLVSTSYNVPTKPIEQPLLTPRKPGEHAEGQGQGQLRHKMSLRFKNKFGKKDKPTSPPGAYNDPNARSVQSYFSNSPGSAASTPNNKQSLSSSTTPNRPDQGTPVKQPQQQPKVLAKAQESPLASKDTPEATPSKVSQQQPQQQQQQRQVTPSQPAQPQGQVPSPQVQETPIPQSQVSSPQQAQKSTSPPPPQKPTSPQPAQDRAVNKSPTRKPVPSAKSSLNAFKFPLNSNASSESGITTPSESDQVSGHKKSPPPPVETATAPAPASPPLISPLPQHIVDLSRKTHRPSGSEDSVAIANFIQAGRAVGITDERLRDVLVQKGVFVPSGQLNFGDHSSTNRSMPQVSHRSQDSQGSVLSGKASYFDKDLESVPEDGQAKEEDGKDARVVVRRTLVLPSTVQIPGLDTLPQSDSFSSVSQVESSRDSSTPKMQRQTSIRRKPIQLSEADQDLMARSPQSPTHKRNPSVQTSSSAQSELPMPQRPWKQDDGRRLSQASEGSNRDSSGSLYDFYGNEPSDNARTSQAVEITEYADGRVVWNIVNALRSGGERVSQVDPVASVRASFDVRDSHHGSYGGRESLVESEVSQDSRGATEGTFRVGPTAGLSFMRRPETRVFYTDAEDVGALIDHLSSDVGGAARGRIDIRPLSPTGAAAPAAGSQAVRNLRPTNGPFSSPGQFADAPSPSPAFGPAKSPLKHSFRSDAQAGAHARYAAAMGLGPTYNTPSGSSHARAGSSPDKSSGGLSPVHPASQAQSQSQSPLAPSFGSSDTSHERTVEDRLQSLMDRLRTAPGGVGKAAGVWR